jgi:hypothetical protein
MLLLLEGYISNFTCTRYYFLYVELSNFYVNQSLAGQTLSSKQSNNCKTSVLVCLIMKLIYQFLFIVIEKVLKRINCSLTFPR